MYSFYSIHKITIIFVKIKKSCIVFKASPDHLCSSCIQRSRARSMLFHQHLQGSRSDATRSCLRGFPKTCRSLWALDICECSTVKFGTCSFHHKSAWLRCAVDGKFRTIPDSSCIDSVEGSLSRSSRWAGIPCRLPASPRTEFATLSCKPWPADCAVWSRKPGRFGSGLASRLLWIFSGFANWRFEWSCWSFLPERALLHGSLSTREKKRNLSCTIIFTFFIENWKDICDAAILRLGDLRPFTTVFVDTRLWKTKHPRKRFQNFRQIGSKSTNHSH